MGRWPRGNAHRRSWTEAPENPPASLFTVPQPEGAPCLWLFAGASTPRALASIPSIKTPCKPLEAAAYQGNGVVSTSAESEKRSPTGSDDRPE